jgi:4-alpha-glucanotransferase/alpha-amylase
VGRVLFVDRQNGKPVRYQRPSVQGTRAGLTANGIGKSISIEGNRLSVAYKFDGVGTPLQTEISLAMPSCDGFLGRYVVNGEIPGGFGQPYTWDNITALTLEDGVLGGKVVITTDRPVTVQAAPHKTVSQSEDGFEKIMQAVTLRIVHPQSPGLAIVLTVE